MEKVNSIYLSRLSNDDHYDFMYDFNNYVLGSQKKIKRFEKEAKAFNLAFENETMTLFTDRKSDHVRNKNEFDDIQYDNAMSMKAIVRAYARTSLKEESQAAKKLLKVFKKNPFDDKSSSAERISNINILCLYLSRDEEQSAIRLLGLSKLYNTLKEANSKCGDEQHNIIKEKENRRLNSMANTRAASDKAYKDYVEAIEIYAYTEDSATLRQEIENINDVIKHFNSERRRISAIRATFAKKKEMDAKE